MGWGAANVAKALENFFGGNIRAVVEEGGVTENGLEIFGDLGIGLARCLEDWKIGRSEKV